MTKFPTNFLWGGALSNVQAEGAYLEDGKGLNVYDTTDRGQEAGQAGVYVASSNGSDHYHRYQEDIKLMQEMGYNAYRFSIVWSRIHPTGIETTPNQAGLDYYEAMIDCLLEHGIEPVVSLVHFDMPDYLATNFNGFMSREVVDYYQQHVAILANYFAEKVNYWITYNEINCLTDSRLVSGSEKPAEMSLADYYCQLTEHMQLAHAKAVLEIKQANPKAQVSGMIAYEPYYPKSCQPQDILAAANMNNFHNFLPFDVMVKGRFPKYYQQLLRKNKLTIRLTAAELELIKKAALELDFLSISYYKTRVVSQPALAGKELLSWYLSHKKNDEINPYLEETDWKWAIDPIGLRYALKTLAERYEKPVFIVENGIGLKDQLTTDKTVEDNQRILFHQNHLANMAAAMEKDGVALLGYLAWAPIDFLSAHREASKRYGFVYVDNIQPNVADFARYPKKSFYWYQQVISSNGAVY